MIRQWVRDSILAFMDLVPITRPGPQLALSYHYFLPLDSPLFLCSRTSTDMPVDNETRTTDNENSTYYVMIVVYMGKLWLCECLVVIVKLFQ